MTHDNNPEHLSNIPDRDEMMMNFLRDDVVGLKEDLRQMEYRVQQLNEYIGRAARVAVTGSMSMICIDTMRDKQCDTHEEGVVPIEVPNDNPMLLGGAFAEHVVGSEIIRDEQGRFTGYRKEPQVVFNMGPVEGTDCESYYTGDIEKIKLFFNEN